jgi:hypothetical protein
MPGASVCSARCQQPPSTELGAAETDRAVGAREGGGRSRCTGRCVDTATSLGTTRTSPSRAAAPYTFPLFCSHTQLSKRFGCAPPKRAQLSAVTMQGLLPTATAVLGRFAVSAECIAAASQTSTSGSTWAWGEPEALWPAVAASTVPASADTLRGQASATEELPKQLLGRKDKRTRRGKVHGSACSTAT